MPGGGPQVLAALALEAEDVVETWLAYAGATVRLGQVGRSKHIRRTLRETDIMERIDAAARRIFPEHVS